MLQRSAVSQYGSLELNFLTPVIIIYHIVSHLQILKQLQLSSGRYLTLIYSRTIISYKQLRRIKRLAMKIQCKFKTTHGTTLTDSI